MEEVYEKLSQDNKDRIEKIFGSLDNIFQPPSYKSGESKPLNIYSVAMSAKSDDDMRGLRVTHVAKKTAPQNFEDYWAFNFLKIAANGYLTSGTNMRDPGKMPTTDEKFGFNVTLDDGRPIVAYDGKKEVAVRTRSVEELKGIINERFDQYPDVKEHYNYTIYTDEAKVEDEGVQYLEGSGLSPIAQDLHDSKKCKSVLVGAGPKTCHKYFKKGQAAQNPFDVIYLALHFGVVDKENLVYGDECAIDFLAPEEAEDSEYNLRDGFEIVHEQDEEVGGAKWRYYVLHKKVQE